MACFIVPGTEAIVSTVITKVIEKKEQKQLESDLSSGVSLSELNKEKFSSKLKRLNGLLWGGSVLLAFEHVWHGEVQPFFPFLTAASSATELTEMFHEMATVGVGMAVAVTLVWGVGTWATDMMSKNVEKNESMIEKVK